MDRDLTDEDVAEMLAAAEGATSGEWRIVAYRDDLFDVETDEEGVADTLYACDARFLVAAQPGRVVALVERLRRAEAERDALAAKLARVVEAARAYRTRLATVCPHPPTCCVPGCHEGLALDTTLAEVTHG